MNILFTASEAVPYSASGGLADVIGSLPEAISRKGHKCSVVIPLYSTIDKKIRSEMTFIKSITVDVSWRKQYCGIFKHTAGNVDYYFIDNEYYFNREGLYGFYDDCERFVFFDYAVLAMLKHIDFKPDIIHCHDWQTALIPVYHSIFCKHKPEFENIKTIFTVHNIEYQGRYGREVLGDVMGIPEHYVDILEYDGYINMMKGAFETADYITTVSPSYAWEISDPWYSHGLDRIITGRHEHLRGILNGIDYDLYNPETDNLLAENFSAGNISGKEICKKMLLAEQGLSEDNSPVIAIITRFVNHKGIDLIRCVFEEMVDMGIKFVILGSGIKIYEDVFREMSARYPDRVSVTLGFRPELARKIYAGADMFLMPSRSEPCGLAQMIAMRYGTIPIVRETGGLRDSVRDDGNKDGNGFTFMSYNANDMLDAVKRAVISYEDKKTWSELIGRAMKSDYSWNKSADLYINLYNELV
ncbi:MAG: glycogen synthase GlgA [Ruminococcus sp.]|nr:glycogen synthase GlgA [Ruminococcus sp.]